MKMPAHKMLLRLHNALARPATLGTLATLDERARVNP